MRYRSVGRGQYVRAQNVRGQYVRGQLGNVVKDIHPVRIEVRSRSLASIAEVSELVNVEAVKAVGKDLGNSAGDHQGRVFIILV